MTSNLNPMEHTCMQLNHKKPELLALDLDGTLFNDSGRVTAASVAAIQKAAEAGVKVVVATGRDYDSVPWEQIAGTDISYAITTNGSAVYQKDGRICLYEECLPAEKMASVFAYLLEKEVYISVFIDGKNYTPKRVFPYLANLELPDYVINIILNSRTGIDDLVGCVKSGNAKIQKATLLFQKQEDGSFLNYEDVKNYLENCPEITVVDGGFHNLEFTKASVSKGTGLRFLAAHLGVPMERTMAIGDSENDIEILKAAGLGIAMGNAPETVKAHADTVTRTNEEEGVAHAIEEYVL